MKYKTLEELAAAYRSGELSKKNKLQLDNDTAFVYVGDEEVWRTDSPPESDLLSEALTLLGVPHEGV